MLRDFFIERGASLFLVLFPVRPEHSFSDVFRQISELLRKPALPGFGSDLTIAAIILWNTVYLGRAVAELRTQGEKLPDCLLGHLAPLGWEHISFNGDYVWPTEPLKEGFRPLRNPRSVFLDSA